MFLWELLKTLSTSNTFVFFFLFQRAKGHIYFFWCRNVKACWGHNAQGAVPFVILGFGSFSLVLCFIRQLITGANAHGQTWLDWSVWRLARSLVNAPTMLKYTTHIKLHDSLEIWRVQLSTATKKTVLKCLQMLINVTEPWLRVKSLISARVKYARKSGVFAFCPHSASPPKESLLSV